MVSTQILLAWAEKPSSAPATMNRGEAKGSPSTTSTTPPKTRTTVIQLDFGIRRVTRGVTTAAVMVPTPLAVTTAARPVRPPSLPVK